MPANKITLHPLLFDDFNFINEYGIVLKDYLNLEVEDSKVGFGNAKIPKDLNYEKLTVSRNTDTTYLQMTDDIFKVAKRYFDQFAEKYLPKNDAEIVIKTNTFFEIRALPPPYWDYIIILKNDAQWIKMIFGIKDIF